MVNVLIDFSYLFHKTLGIFTGYGKDKKEPGEVLEKLSEQKMFMRKIITDLCYGLSQIPDIKRVVICKDSKSWRKDFIIDRKGYKESRTEKEGTNWGCFYNLMEECGNHLEENGFIYSQIKGAEGDDLIWAWNRRFRMMGENVLIYSGDGDMHQLINHSIDQDSWTIVWNSKSKDNRLFVPPNWIKDIEGKSKEISIFDVNPIEESIENKLKSFIEKSTVEEIERKSLIFKKILIGDKGDDVPSVMSIITQDSKTEGNPEGKSVSVTPAKAEKIWLSFLESGWKNKELWQIWKSEDYLTWISGYILRIIGATDNTENRELAKKQYIENATLLWLHSETIPSEVKEAVEQTQDKLLSVNVSPIMDKKKLIESSVWSGDSAYVPSGFNPFKNY